MPAASGWPPIQFPLIRVCGGTQSAQALWNETLVAQILEGLSANKAGRGADEQKIGDFYFACMDETGIEAHAREWLKRELERIDRLKSKSNLAAEIAHLHQTIRGAWWPRSSQTDAALFGFSGYPGYDDASRNIAQIDQGGMGLPGRNYYMAQDDKFRGIRAKYLRHIQNVFTLAGRPLEQAKTDGAVVLEIETALARAAIDAVARRDPKNVNNKLSLEQLKALTPSFDWQSYLTLIDAPASPQYIVAAPNFFKNLEVLLRDRPLSQWKIYLRWQWLHGAAGRLSAAFVDENFDFYRQTPAAAVECHKMSRNVSAGEETITGGLT